MRQYILYGAVFTSEYRPIISEVKSYIDGMKGKIVGCVDSNPEKWNENLGVYSPDFIKDYPGAIIVIMSDKIREIRDNIRKLGYRNEIVVFPFLRSSFYDRYSSSSRSWCLTNEKKLRDIYVKGDEETQNILNEMIQERIQTDFSFVPYDIVMDFSHINLYFYDESIAPKGNITLVNGGAYTGDSIEEIYRYFGERLNKVYAFEPDKKNMSILQDRMKKLEIDNMVVPINAGMSDQEGEMQFFGGGTVASAFGQGEEIVPLTTIDSVLEQVEGDLCINMDVEGFEVKAIHGARESILRHHPYLAICVYHKMGDFLDVPMAIKAIRDDYKFYLRCGVHPECYAVPVGRELRGVEGIGAIL